MAENSKSTEAFYMTSYKEGLWKERHYCTVRPNPRYKLEERENYSFRIGSRVPWIMQSGGFLDGWMDREGDKGRESFAPCSSKKQRLESGRFSFNCGYSSIQVWTLGPHAVKPSSPAATGHCPGVSCDVKTEDYCGI